MVSSTLCALSKVWRRHMIEVVKSYEDGKKIFRLKNEKLTVDVSNYGGTILSIVVVDKNGKKQDVVLGYDHLEDYAHYDGYLGALVGRVANRIAKGTFTLNDKTYQLAINNGPNCLHGGVKGFSYRIFDDEIKNDQLILHYFSPDGEEHFPGNLDLYATYELKEDALVINYHATSDQDTLINITNHSYFNINGYPSSIDNHTLQVQAQYFACSDEDGLVTGALRDVDHTPFDFKEEKTIGSQIHQEDEQLTIGHGYDHPFIFNANEDQVKLYSPLTGIELTVSTTLPQAQLYSANYLDGRLGKNGQPMNARDAFAIETQYMPDSIHKERNSKTILRKGEAYDETTSYCFKVRS